MSEKERISFNALYQDCLRDGKLMFAGRLLWRAAQFNGDGVALIYNDENITYKTLYARAAALQQKIVEKFKVKPRDRAIIFFENSPQFYIAYFALWQAGVVVVPVNTFLKTKELEHIINDSQPALIATASHNVSLFEQTGCALPPIITENDMQDVKEYDVISRETIVDLEPDDLAALLYTSGTTGLPKGVMLSSKNIMTNVLQIAALLDVPHHERILGVLPLFHSFAQNTCVWASIFYGITIILVSKIDRKAILEGLHHKPTIFLGVPALYGMLCLMKTAPLDSVRLFVSGGDALPDKIRAGFALLYRRKIANGYGLTETSPVLSVNLEDEVTHTSSVGRPLIGVECSIRGENGIDLPCGDIGVIWVKGDNVMLGYYRAEKATHDVLVGGWFNTGDLGYRDASGAIIITGRQKDLIIHKGFNIYPQEIENVLLSHANVIRAAVVGKHDGDGEVPVAFIQLRSEQNNIERELRSLCMQHLAIYKIPKQFICDTKDLPMTATGKVDKKVLRKFMTDEI
jgi:long-chain acyl-CoA synthetase